MAKNLVIVESPAKAKTIGKYLGRDYQVKASVGHVMDLPKSKLGVDVKKGFAAEYQVIQGKAKIIEELRKAAKDKERIFLASDPDREGEAIAWHIAEKLTKKGQKVHRILLNEITKKAVQAAVQNPTDLNRDRYNAQVARRILDRLVGYQLSPLLWKKVRRGLSAGRVQSVAVRIITEREREVLAFVPEEYWSIIATLEGAIPPQFEARLARIGDKRVDNKTFRISNDAEAKEILAHLDGATWTVAKVEKRERRRNPAPPFITSRLQQEASRKLGYAPSRTMGIAQR
jgi:DNA topoisomerase I